MRGEAYVTMMVLDWGCSAMDNAMSPVLKKIPTNAKFHWTRTRGVKRLCDSTCTEVTTTSNKRSHSQERKALAQNETFLPLRNALWKNFERDWINDSWVATFFQNFANLSLRNYEELQCISELLVNWLSFVNHWNGVSTHWYFEEYRTNSHCPHIAIKHQGRIKLC